MRLLTERENVPDVIECMIAKLSLPPIFAKKEAANDIFIGVQMALDMGLLVSH